MVFTEFAIILGSCGATLYGATKLFGDPNPDKRTREQIREDDLKRLRNRIDKEYYSSDHESEEIKIKKENEIKEFKKSLSDVPEYYSHYKTINEKWFNQKPCSDNNENNLKSDKFSNGKVCGKCNSTNDVNYKYCIFCGAKL